MKKLLLLVAVVAAGFTANAQEKAKGGFEKQDWYVSGSVGYTNVSVEGADTDVNTFTFSPAVGYFVSDNIALELGLITGSSSTDTPGGKIESNSFGVSLGGNYFFTPQNDFSFILGAGISYVSTGSELFGVEQPDTNTFGIAVVPGINYFISEKVALRATVGALSYSNQSSDANGVSSVSTFGLNLDLSNINFGITYKF